MVLILKHHLIVLFSRWFKIVCIIVCNVRSVCSLVPKTTRSISWDTTYGFL